MYIKLSFFFSWSPQVVWAYGLIFNLFSWLFLNTKIDTVQTEEKILSYPVMCARKITSKLLLQIVESDLSLLKQLVVFVC